ncbi:MAG: lipoyl protein ligase domain-containing protein [Pelagimonas sp.]|uniref:lipoyl protein ligase domain-containing protein n=1 Tax=Pelagimonas sp. TaxID=2073170 RepID=UPI003D6C18E5
MIIAPFASAADGIAREAALLQAGRAALLLWQADESALVLPSAIARRTGTQSVMRDIKRAGLGVVTRGTGGGIVPQGACTLNLAMVLPCPSGFTLEDGYRLICGTLTEALSRFDISAHTGACPGAFCDGAWNVLAGERKLAGTAQRWRSTRSGRVALLHAAILLHLPDPGHWAELCLLHQAAFPDAPVLRPEAHAPLFALMPENMHQTSFPGALIRAAEDRLSSLSLRENQAA